MIDESKIEKQLDRLQYMSNWVSLHSLKNKCTPKKPFLKLRKFPQTNFKRKHEMTINHLYFQKLYMVCHALEENLRLQISQNYYEANGVIFGVYEFYHPGHGPKNMSGISMKEEVDGNQDLSRFYDIIQEQSSLFFNYVEKLGFNPQDQYKQWSLNISEIFKKDLKIKPYKFIEEFQKLTLTQHYVFNVKLKNALLMPTLLKSHEFMEKFEMLIKEEKHIINELLFQSAEPNETIKKLQGLMREVWTTLEKKCKVVELNLGSAQVKKVKQTQAEFKIQLRFLIILSPSRGKAVINEQPVQNADNKDSKALTKIQIKPQNGSILPVSGNVINVSMAWEVFPDEKKYRLKVQCYNNRKVEEMYFDELQQFWYKLVSNESFRDLVGVDKYSMFLNQKKAMETVFMNFVPGCSLIASIKQIDKIVSLAISMDEAIEVCERKGSELEDPKNFELEPYMLDHIQERYKRALTHIEANSEQLFKSFMMRQY